MNEWREILAGFECLEVGERAAIATVVKVEGSVYRRPGARMLITSSGLAVGTISGGCLESDVRERALRMMAVNAARGAPADKLTDGPSDDPSAKSAVLSTVVKYDLMAEDDQIFGLGKGCNGVTYVLIEPFDPSAPCCPIRFLTECAQTRQHGVMGTVISIQGESLARPGMRLLLRPGGQPMGDVGDRELELLLTAEMGAALVGGRSCLRRWQLKGREIEAFIEVVHPPIPMIVFGAGYDAIPLVRLAKELGRHVTVVDHRLALATQKRFPTADVVICARPESLPAELMPDEQTVVVVMTHHYEHDLKLLEILLPLPLRYLGILGPKSRTRRLLADIEAAGIEILPDRIASLHGPAGLDIGAETPEEIALSILAEIQMALTGRSGGSLKDTAGPIH